MLIWTVAARTRRTIDNDAICSPDHDVCAYLHESDVVSDEICGDVDSCEHDAENYFHSGLLCRDVESYHLDAENNADADLVCGNLAYDAENDADHDLLVETSTRASMTTKMTPTQT